MKTLYTTTVFLLLMSGVLRAQTYTQYFDGADTIFDYSVNVEIDTAESNIWQIGKPQKILFDSAATLPNVIITDTLINYPVNNISQFFIKMINQFYPYGIIAIQWKQKLDIDTAYDGGIVEFTMDNGVSWENIFNNPYVYNLYGFEPSSLDTLITGEYAFNGTDTVWRDIWLCFDLSWISAFPDTIMLRFTFKSDSTDNNREGWMIDNFIAHMTYIHSVKDISKNNYLNVYPNPSNGIIHIEAEKLMDFHIIEHMELMDAQGLIMEQWKNIPTKFWFDAGKYGTGLYFLRVTTNIKTETIPVFVSKN